MPTSLITRLGRFLLGMRINSMDIKRKVGALEVMKRGNKLAGRLLIFICLLNLRPP